MPSDNGEFDLPNLAALRDTLSGETDARSLLAAFDAESLVDARHALRQIAADWATPATHPDAARSPADEVGS